MKPQGLDEYTAGSKKNWRGWEWNRIVERLMVPVEDALVLYLCGPDDLDRKKALEKGFRPENLIAVDLLEDNVRKVRNAGGIGISHDFGALVREWPADWPIDVIVADFCKGFDRYIARFGLDLLTSPGVSPWVENGTLWYGDTMRHFCVEDFRTVLAINLQRGRDAWSNGIRNNLRRSWPEPLKGLELHRGVIWVLGFLDGFLKQTGAYSFREMTLLNHGVSWVHNSYRSNVVVMDSAVMRLPGVTFSNPLFVCHAPPDNTARRKIAACRAVRTMMLKKNGGAP